MAFLEKNKLAVKGKEARRPWWLRKTEDGTILIYIGIAMAFFPATKEYCLKVIEIGGALLGVGVVHRNIKQRNEDKS